MAYQEKRTIVMILTGIAVLAAYCITAFNPAQAGMINPGDLKAWARLMLIFIGIGIGATIVIQIVFHILLSISTAISRKIQDQSIDDKEIERSIEAEMVEDEMGKLIELKSTRINTFFMGAGFVAGLLSLLFNYPPAVMINIFFIAVSLGAIIEGFAQLYFYRRGVQHG